MNEGGKTGSFGFQPCGDGERAAAGYTPGPVETLCKEIVFEFDRRLERTDVFVAFVRELVAEVAQRREIAVAVAEYTGKLPSEGSRVVLNLAEAMLSVESPAALRGGALLVHEAADRLNPDDAYPTDHLIDMLSGCASAIRFGLDERGLGYTSRHAASAAQHIWKHVYGVSLFDRHTPAWEKDWIRVKLLNAIISLLPPALNLPTEDTSNAGRDGE